MEATMERSGVMDRLKRRTRDVHTRTERRPLGYAMATRQISVGAYRAYLWGMRAILAELEGRVADSADPRVAAVRAHTVSALPALDEDLAVFRGEPGREVAAVAERVRAQLAEERPVGLLGWLYVFEGSQLGGVILAPRVGGAVGLQVGEAGLRYLEGPADLRPRWGRFRAAMDGCVDEARLEELVDAAHRAFEAVGALFDAVAASEGLVVRRPERPAAAHG